MKAFSQYTWSVRTRAIKSGATALNAHETSTVHSTDTRFTKNPVEMFMRLPEIRDGSTRNEA